MNKVTRSIVEGLISTNKSSRSSIRRKLESDTPNLTREQAEEIISELVRMNDEEFGPFSLGELFHADQEIVLSISTGSSWTDEDILVENLLSDNKIEARIGVRDHSYYGGGGVYGFSDESALKPQTLKNLLNKVNRKVKSLGVKLVMVDPLNYYFTYDAQDQSSNISHLKKYDHKTVGTSSTVKEFNPDDYPNFDYDEAKRVVEMIVDILSKRDDSCSLGQVFEKSKEIRLMINSDGYLSEYETREATNHLLTTHRVEASLVVYDTEVRRPYEYTYFYDESSTDYLDIDSLVAKVNKKFNRMGITFTMDTPLKGHFDYDIDAATDTRNNAIKIVDTLLEILKKYSGKNSYEYKDDNGEDHVIYDEYRLFWNYGYQGSVNNIYKHGSTKIEYVLIDKNKNSEKEYRVYKNRYNDELKSVISNMQSRKIDPKMKNELKSKINARMIPLGDEEYTYRLEIID